MASSRDLAPEADYPCGGPPPVDGVVRASEELWVRARAARDRAAVEAGELLSGAGDEAAAIRRSSDVRVARLLGDADQAARNLLATAYDEAARLEAAAAPLLRAPTSRSPAAWGLIVGLVVGSVAMLLGHGGPLAVLVVVAVSLVGPGLGVVLALGDAAGPARAVTTVLLSVCWSGAVALTAAWTTFQAPVIQYAALVLPALAGAAIAVRRGGRTSRPSPRSVTRTGPVAAGLLLVVGSASMYVIATLTTSETPVGAFGLLPALGPWFWASVALAVAAVVVAALMRPASIVLGSAGLGTVAFLCMPPRVLLDHNLLAGWAYKHLGVVDLIVQQQPLQDPLDVYQQWPGFFALAAQVQVISGVDPLVYANFAQPLLVVMAAGGLGIAVHRLFGDRLTPLLATLLFVCTMWAGQFYFAPQTLCFALAMLCLVHIITLLQSLPQRRLRTGWPGRSLGWALRDLPPPRPLEPAGRIVLVVTVVATYVLVVVSHQITPYILVLQLAPAALAGWLAGRWRWGYLLLAALPILWLYLHRDVLGTTTALTGFSVANAQSLVTGPSSDAQELAALNARVVAALVLGGGTLAALTYVRRLGVVLVPVVLGTMPALVLLAGNYGGEAPYRVWLFASPWFCALLAKRVGDLARRRAAAVIAVGVVSVGTFLGSAQASTFGMYPFLSVSDDAVTASRWLGTETPPGSTIVHLTRMFPGRISAGYAQRNPLHTINDPVLIDYPRFRWDRLVESSAADLRDEVVAEFGRDAYLVLARSMEAETRYFGVLPRGAVGQLADALLRSPSWDLAYANAEVWVFRPR